jgi:hypothetical protein
VHLGSKAFVFHFFPTINPCEGCDFRALFGSQIFYFNSGRIGNGLDYGIGVSVHLFLRIFPSSVLQGLVIDGFLVDRLF